MRNHKLLTALLLPVAITSACSLSTDSSDDPLLGDCIDDTCGNDDGGGDHDDNNCSTGGGAEDCSGGDGGSGGVDVDVDLDLDAELTLEVVGSGIYIGLSPLTCLDLSGDFSLHANAEARFDGDSYVIANVAANASLDVGSGCSCSGIDVNAIAAIKVDASIDANIETCANVCLGDSSCESACNQDGNTIKAHATLDASACAAASVSIGGDINLDALVGLDLHLEAHAVVDIHGAVLVHLD